MLRRSPWLGLGAVLVFTLACDNPSSNRTREASDHRPGDSEEVAQPMGGEVAENRPDDDRPLTISRDWCSEARCPVTFHFSHPMVKGPRRGLGRAVSLSFSPAQAGTYRWKSPRELVFEPGPRSMRWGHEITASISAATAMNGAALGKPWRETFRVPYFTVAGKVATWPIVEGRPRFIAFLNGRDGQIGAGPLYLLFDQPVSPALVGKSVRLSHGDSIVRTGVFRPKSIANAYSGKVDTRLIVAVRGRKLPADGSQLKLQYPKILDGPVPEMNTRELSVSTQFTLDSVAETHTDTSGDPVPERAVFGFSFSNPVSTRALEEAVSLTPTAENLRVSWSWGNEAYVTATLEPGRSYRLTVSPDVRDELGNRLGKRHTMDFTVHDLPSRLEVPSQPMVLERGHARVPIAATNTGVIQAGFRAIESPQAFIRALRSGPSGCPQGHESAEKTWSSSRANRAKNVTHDVQVEPARATAKTAAMGCLTVRAKADGSRDSQSTLEAAVPVQVTNLGATAKIHARGITTWVTRLSDAAPVSGARVRLFDERGKVVATATTDNDGLAELDSAEVARRVTERGGLQQDSYLVVDRSGDAGKRPGDAGKRPGAAGNARTAGDMVVAELTDKRMSQPWQFNMRGDVADRAALVATVFTDRGVYRPSETVHVQVVARDPDRGYTARKGKIAVTVTDPRGAEVTRRRLALDQYGSADLDIALRDDARVGGYRIQVAMGDQVSHREFRVEEYRVPTFEVKVSSDAAWESGQQAQASVAARYLHGGDLASRTVRYTVSRERAAFNPKNFGGFVFANRTEWATASGKLPEGVVAKGEARLDGRGHHEIAFDTTHPASAGPMRYVVDASVTDVDRQVYAGRLARVVHPSPFYVGVRPAPARVLASGDFLSVPVVAVTPDGKTRAGVPVTVELRRIDYHTSARLQGKKSVQLENRPVAKRVRNCSVRTGKKPVACRLRIPASGQYVVVASAQHGRVGQRAGSRRVEAGFSLYAGGSHTVAWPRYEHERIDIIADKTRYRPGETARLMIASPFTRARGLLTLERDGVVEHKQFVIDGDAPVIDVPITDAHAPNVYASVTLLQPRVHDKRDATGYETGAPAFRMGYTELGVVPSASGLDVQVTSAKTAHPGGKLQIELAARDHRGATARGRATVMVVDEAVLGLTGYRTPDPLADIFASRPLGVRTVASMLDLPHSRRARHEQIFVSGDGGPGFGLSPFAPELRNLFKSTAYWNPAVDLDDRGRATLSIDLPDNVTTYRVMAVVFGKGAHFGSSDAKVVVKKPLMVKPVLPRFVYPGDSLRVEARVFNGTEDLGRVEVAAAFAGLEHAGTGKASGKPGESTVDVPAGKSATVAFPARVTGTGKAKVRLTARIGRWHSDAVEVEIPVLDPGAHRSVVIRQPVNGSSAQATELAIELPADRIPGSESLEVLVSNTRLSQLKESVDYLMGYPHGCIEQTTSRAYPLLVLGDLLPEMGVTANLDDLKKFAEAGVKRLLSFQTSSGGLAYWPGSDNPHAFGTAFGGAALIEAKRRGFEVPDAALDRMADYLEQSLRQGKISEEMPHGGMADADTRALFVMTLGRMGKPQPSYVATLWRQRDKLTAFGSAFLAVAASELDRPDRSLMDAMLADVRAKAKEEASEAYYEGKADGGWSMGSPLRTHATALLAYAKADPAHAMKGKLLTGLLNRQQNGLWGNTQENVFGIMAVAHSVNAGQPSTGKPRAGSKAEPKIELTINGAAQSRFEPVGQNGYKVRLAAGQLRGEAGRSAAQTIAVSNRQATPIFVTARADYDVALNPRTMAPRDAGFAVSRRYETLRGTPIDPKAIKLGSLIRVRIRIESRKKHNYVAIEDRLPAGLEALNANLATTEKVAAGALSAEAQRGLAVLSHHEIRDERVSFYADELPVGVYEMVYVARATTKGRFLRPAAGAEAMYQPDVAGSSAIDHVEIR